MGVPPKAIGAMKNPKITPGGFSMKHRIRTSCYDKNSQGIPFHQEIKEAANKVLQRSYAR